MASPRPSLSTLRDLRASGYAPRSVREEIRENLLARLRAGKPIFEGVLGYEDSVVPAVENALLCGHDLIFLGERGQAKSRMMRQLVSLLDEWLPVIPGWCSPRGWRSPPPARRRAGAGGSPSPARRALP